jgi:hypothetical protein
MIEQKSSYNAGDPPVDLVARINYLIALFETKLHLSPYVSDLEARKIIGGGKAVDKNLFNSLRKKGLITTYFPTPGRCLYKVAELNEYIEGTASLEILPARHKKALSTP